MKKLFFITLIALGLFINATIVSCPSDKIEAMAAAEVPQTEQQIEGDITEEVKENNYDNIISEKDVNGIAEVVFAESRGIKSLTEQACVVWCILNRVDAGYGSIQSVINSPNQFAKISGRYFDDYGRDIKVLAKDVMVRWHREKSGETDVGRVLPSTYLYFSGRKGHNFFREKCYDFSSPWNYALQTPYEN